MITNENTAMRLLRGSQAIDRMRSDVNKVISMIRGLLPGMGVWKIDERFVFEKTTWTITGVTSYSEGNTFECWIPVDKGLEGVYKNDGRSAHLCPKDVETVYDDLPLFVDSLLKKYPVLKQRLQPFLDVADKFE
ncbi:MAG: hypothetical protein WCO30_00835 [bacterium]